MSLLLMPTETPLKSRGLSPNWGIFRRKSASDESARPRSRSRSIAFLSPKPTTFSSDSDESRSVQSSQSRGRRSLKHIMNRLRSTSSVTLVDEPQLKESDFKQLENWKSGFERYNQLVTTQVSGNDTYPPEDFSKMTGILSKTLGGRFIHGLPEAVFDYSLLWCPAGSITRKDSNEPSWSWTSWEGPVNFPFDPTNCPDLQRIARSEGELFRSEILKFHIGPEATPYEVRREKREEALRIRYPSTFHPPRGYDASTDSDTLRFTAMTISANGFTAEQLDYNEKEIACSHLLNNKQQLCGVIMDFESSISKPSSDGPFEFVLLSRNIRPKESSHTRKYVIPTNHPAGTPIWDGVRFVWDQEVADYDEDIFEYGPWNMLNVMLIKWVGGHAERVAVARIHEDAWMAQSPQKQEIVLR